MRAASVKWVAGIICVAGVILAVLTRSEMVQFWSFSVEDVVRLLTPLVLTALFIERALEVFLTPWRGEQADHIADQVERARKSMERGQTESREDLSRAQTELIAYKAETRQVAFVSALALGIVISALGIRGLEPFFEPNSFATLPSGQHILLRGVDVLLTGALLGGGADGLHKLVSVFTNYMDSAAKRAKA
jgi:hypothetical protein